MWKIDDPGSSTSLTAAPKGAPLAQLVGQSGNRQFPPLLAINLTSDNQQAVTGAIPAQPVFVGKFFSLDLGTSPEEIDSASVGTSQMQFVRRPTVRPVGGGFWQMGSRLGLLVPDSLVTGVVKIIYKKVLRPKSGDFNKEFDVSAFKNFAAQSIDSGGLIWRPAINPSVPTPQEMVQVGGKVTAYGNSTVRIPGNAPCLVAGEATFSLPVSQGIQVLGFDLSSMADLWHVDAINRDGKIYAPPAKIELIGQGNLLYNRINKIAFLLG